MRWTVGDVTITRVEERIVAVPAQSLLPAVTPDLIASVGSWLAPYFEDDGRIRLSNHAFVVETPETTIVVDTCVGHGRERPLPGDSEFAERLGLALAGGLDSVDVVVCTHMHFDHVGWNTVEIDGKLTPTFANARYLFGRIELDALAEDDHYDIGSVSVAPIIAAGQADIVEADHRIDRWVSLTPTPGHTPGHVSVAIDGGDADQQGLRAFITGDAFHSPLQIARPEVSATPFDHDSQAAIRTRNELLAQLAGSQTLVLGTHFAPPTAGVIESTDTGCVFGIRLT